MKRTVYVSETVEAQLRSLAKRTPNFNLSRLVQQALIKELNRQAVQKGDPDRITIPLLGKDNKAYLGTFTGTTLMTGEVFTVFLRTDKRIIQYDRKRKIYRYMTVSEIESLLPKREYIKVMHALGKPPVIWI